MTKHPQGYKVCLEFSEFANKCLCTARTIEISRICDDIQYSHTVVIVDVCITCVGLQMRVCCYCGKYCKDTRPVNEKYPNTDLHNRACTNCRPKFGSYYSNHGVIRRSKHKCNCCFDACHTCSRCGFIGHNILNCYTSEGELACAACVHLSIIPST